MSNLNQEAGSFNEQEQVAGEGNNLSAKASVQMPVKSRRVKKSKDAFRTISEVANKLDVQQHVLRFWETKFSHVRPLKRGGGRRYYRPEDVALLTRIHHLLYTEGYTIKGVQKLLKEQGKAQMIATQVKANETGVQPKMRAKFQAEPEQAEPQQVEVSAQQPQKTGAGVSAKQRAVLEIMLAELKAMRAMIKV